MQAAKPYGNLVTANIIVIGHDPRLQTSQAIAQGKFKVIIPTSCQAFYHLCRLGFLDEKDEQINTFVNKASSKKDWKCAVGCFTLTAFPSYQFCMSNNGQSRKGQFVIQNRWNMQNKKLVQSKNINNISQIEFINPNMDHEFIGSAMSSL